MKPNFKLFNKDKNPSIRYINAAKWVEAQLLQKYHLGCLSQEKFSLGLLKSRIILLQNENVMRKIFG